MMNSLVMESDEGRRMKPSLLGEEKGTENRWHISI